MPAWAAEEHVTVSGTNFVVWSRPATVKQPVIIFSHGFHECATQSRFLMEAFASAGYIAFAPNHHDATCNNGDQPTGFMIPDVPFRQPAVWNDTAYRDRADDIRRLLNTIGTDDRFRQHVDLSRIGLVGHSLGGYTVLGLGGAWPTWILANVKAVLAFSPYAEPFLSRRTLSGLSTPVMYQGGSKDYSVTPAVKKASGAYDQSPEPKYYVEFKDAGHFAWADTGFTGHNEIVAYSLAFMNHYVKGSSAENSLTHKLPGVSQLWYASDLGHSE